MEKIQWQNNLSVGIELIDNQHQKWIRTTTTSWNPLHPSRTKRRSRRRLVS